MNEKRIAITGLGIICSAGKDISSFTDALLTGNSGIGQIDLFDVAPFYSRIGAQVKGYDPLDHFDRKSASRLSRADQFGVVASKEALKNSGVLDCYGPFDMGVSMGAGAAGMFQSEQWLKANLAGAKGDSSLLRGMMPDKTSTVIAETFCIAGYQGTITTACSSAATAIGWGADLVASGKLKAVLCGGSDTLSILTFAGFNALKVVDVEPCSPFSLGRQGISLGEGAAFMVLEDADAAIARGARIHGFVRGYAVAGEAYHMTAPEPSGTAAARVMAEALRLAGVTPAEVGWVNAHGTGTPLNDVVETKAMKLVFGERSAQVPLVSTKALTGHCLGAAGAIEAVSTVIALNNGIIPQTLNFRNRDPECDLDYCHDAARPSKATIALSNSFAFGGNVTSLVLEK